jgi:hypothetical protein
MSLLPSAQHIPDADARDDLPLLRFVRSAANA